MMASALSIVKAVAKRLNAPAVPTALYGSTDPATMQWVELLYAVLEELRQAKCWTVQKRKYTFNTEASRSKYPLPLDYYSPIVGTHFNDSADQELIGSIGDAQAAYYLEGGNTPGYDYYYRIFGWDGENVLTEGGQLQLFPTPASAQEISFEYLSRNTLLPKQWAALTAYTIVDYVHINGNIYKCTSNGTSSAADPPSGTATSGIVDGTAQWGYRTTPIEQIAADTDLVIFDYDLVQLGLRAYWLQEKKGELAATALAEFRSRIEKAKARFEGNKIGSFAQGRTMPRYNIPYRGWSL